MPLDFMTITLPAGCLPTYQLHQQVEDTNCIKSPSTSMQIVAICRRTISRSDNIHKPELRFISQVEVRDSK